MNYRTPRIGEMVTVDGAGYALLTIPKVAGTSIRAALLRTHGHELELHRQVHHHPALRFVDTCPFVATFVRHPVDRLVSCWADRIRGERPSEPLRRLGYGPDSSFSGFVREVAEIGTQANVHTAPQVSHLARVAPDFIGRFERLPDDWQRLQGIVGIGPLPHMQRSGREGWRQHADPATEALVRELYADDFRAFGYE